MLFSRWEVGQPYHGLYIGKGELTSDRPNGKWAMPCSAVSDSWRLGGALWKRAPEIPWCMRVHGEGGEVTMVFHSSRLLLRVEYSMLTWFIWKMQI